MPTPTSIPGAPMAHPFQEPTQEAREDTSLFDTIEVFNHVVQTVLNMNKN